MFQDLATYLLHYLRVSYESKNSSQVDKFCLLSHIKNLYHQCIYT